MQQGSSPRQESPILGSEKVVKRREPKVAAENPVGTYPESSKQESLMGVYVKRPQAKKAAQDLSSKIVVKTGVNSSNVNE